MTPQQRKTQLDSNGTSKEGVGTAAPRIGRGTHDDSSALLGPEHHTPLEREVGIKDVPTVSRRGSPACRCWAEYSTWQLVPSLPSQQAKRGWFTVTVPQLGALQTSVFLNSSLCRQPSEAVGCLAAKEKPRDWHTWSSWAAFRKWCLEIRSEERPTPHMIPFSQGRYLPRPEHPKAVPCNPADTHWPACCAQASAITAHSSRAVGHT